DELDVIISTGGSGRFTVQDNIIFHGYGNNYFNISPTTTSLVTQRSTDSLRLGMTMGASSFSYDINSGQSNTIDVWGGINLKTSSYKSYYKNNNDYIGQVMVDEILYIGTGINSNITDTIQSFRPTEIKAFKPLTITDNLTTNAFSVTGSTRTGGAFYSGTTNPANTNRLNYDGYLYAAQFNGNLTTSLVDAIEVRVQDLVINSAGGITSTGDTVFVNAHLKVDSAIHSTSLSVKTKQIRFNESEGVFEFETGKGEVVWQGALEDLVQVYNNTGSTVANGTPFFLDESTGDTIATTGVASANLPTAVAFQGLITGEIADSDWGYGAVRGKVRGLNTIGLSTTGALFLSNDSSYTNTKPAYPSTVVVVGGVISVHATEGIIYVSPSLALQRQIISGEYNFTTVNIGAGIYYKGGFYRAPTTSTALTQASPTVTYGSANSLYDAHGWVVCAGAGSTDAGVVGLEISGTSITDGGVETVGDRDTIILDITGLALDEYYEAKKFIGTITIGLITISGSPTTYSLTINYGFSKYEDLENRDFYLAGCNVGGLASATDASFNVELMHHTTTGWTYAATGFVPGNGAITSIAGTHASYTTISGEEFAWKRTELDQFIDGNGAEGVMFRITTGQNNTVQSMDLRIAVAVD
ncbi:hypothetical protein KAR91_03030, partial [Candidatus Pacearchaeota archaeon]|nr:hypothetical protein [Candidatus Pacearchaeota archaeon]